MPDPHANPAEIVDLAERRPGQPPPGTVVRYRKNRRVVTTVEDLNRRYGLLRTTREIFDIEQCKPLPVAKFEIDLADKVIFIGYNDKNYPVYTPAAKFWLGESGRRIISRLAFTSKPVADDELNLFHGFGVEPKPGCCSRILRHILVVICKGDENTYNRLLDLLAWQAKNIGEPSRIIVVLYSEEQQTGKGVFVEKILVPIFGEAGYFAQEIDNVVGQFNYLIKGKAVVGLDECLFSCNKKIADAIKSISAASSLTVNEKFVSQQTIPFATNLFVLTNRRDAVHIEEGDQRYWVLPVSESKQADPEWFNPLFEEEIRREGLNAFLHFLLSRDVSGFHPQRDIPRDNEEHKKIIQAGIDAADPRHYFAECLEERKFIGFPEPKVEIYLDENCEIVPVWNGGERIPAMRLYGAYRAWVKDLANRWVKAVATATFWEVLTKLGFEVEEGRTCNYRVTPDPDKCTEKLKDFLHK